jgi:hypothetical protein
MKLSISDCVFIAIIVGISVMCWIVGSEEYDAVKSCEAHGGYAIRSRSYTPVCVKRDILLEVK